MLQRVNRIRTEHGVDPLYELPAACTAWDGGGCVLERAFEDLGVLVVDYRRAYGPGVEFEHGLSRFIWDFDAGRHTGASRRPLKLGPGEARARAWPASTTFFFETTTRAACSSVRVAGCASFRTSPSSISQPPSSE